MTPAQPPLFDIGTPDRAKERAGRRELDRYLTPPWVTQALLDAFPEIKGRVLLDPCCGDGRMARALEPRFRILVLNDIDPTSAVSHHEYDAADAALYQIHPADWIVTNPPFNLCGQIAWQAVQHAQVGVALLLRCTFLEPCEGREWLARRPPDAVLALPRISFTGEGTDSAPCWWFVWGARKRVVVNTRAEAAGQTSIALPEAP